LECSGVAAITFCLRSFESSEVGGLCYGGRDCQLGLLCSAVGRCSAGDAGDPCRDDDDCLAMCGDRGSCL
jgi:hypothetical protein